MADVIIEHTRLAANITSKIKPVHLKVPSLLFRITVPTEKGIRDAYDKDPLLRAKMAEAAGKVYDSIERQMEIATRGWDAKVEQVKTDESRRKAAIKDYQKLFEDQVDLAQKAAQRSTEAVWLELAKTKKDYAKYKWKAGIKVTLGVASLITSVTIMASSAATFGATAIPGILGMIRTSAQLAQTCKALYQNLETTIKELNRRLAHVSATYQDASKAKVVASEMAAMLVQKVIAVELDSIKICEDLLGRAESKLGGVVAGADKIAEKLDKALKEVDQIGKKADPKSKKKLEAVSDTITVMIIGIQGEVDRSEKGKRDIANSEKIIKALIAKKPSALALVDKAAIVIDLAAGVAGWEDLVQNTSGVILDLAVDKIFDKV
ncbi:MAG: hypothetical protein ABI699_08130 [Caldimonas sp.]